MGGGSRWREEQAEVLDFAEKLHYDHSPGGSLISETDDKGEWVNWRDKFGSWKDANVAKEDSGQAWWQTYEAPSAAPSGGHSGSSSGLINTPSTPDIGPYPFPNRYFPQLTHAYEAPHAQDISQYMPSNSPFSEFDPLRTYSPFDGMGGLLYQPGTQEYMEQFPMPDNLLNYQPPEINRQPVQYSGSLFGPMNVTAPEDLFVEEEEEEEDDSDQRGADGGDNKGRRPGE
jgi:hypothetical protein